VFECLLGLCNCVFVSVNLCSCACVVVCLCVCVFLLSPLSELLRLHDLGDHAAVRECLWVHT